MAAGGVIEDTSSTATLIATATAEDADTGACSMHGSYTATANGATLLALDTGAEKGRHARNPGAS